MMGRQMAKAKSKETKPEPKAGRPGTVGYGISRKKKGLLPWEWGAGKLRKSREYWIATTRPNGAPHVMVIWGLWLDDGFYFSTGKHSRKARNLAENRNCVICSSDPAEAVIVE